MSNKPTTPPLTPREFISEVRDLIGDTFLIKLFGLSKNTGDRSLQRWTAKRPYVSEDSIRENWIEKHERVLGRLIKESGGLEVARALVARHANIVGCELRCLSQAEPDQDTIEAECLDDYPALADFHEAIRQGKSSDKIHHFWQKAKTELDQTFNKATTIQD